MWVGEWRARMGRCIAEACAIETYLFSDGNLGDTLAGCVYKY